MEEEHKSAGMGFKRSRCVRIGRTSADGEGMAVKNLKKGATYKFQVVREKKNNLIFK